MRHIPLIYIWVIILISGACSPTKRLGEGEVLLLGNAVKFQGDEPENKGNISSDLLEIAEPKPNSKVLGTRLRLGIYNLFGNKKEKGLGYWIKSRLGEPPVLYDKSAVDRSHLIMEKYLIDQGYFQAGVKYDTLMNKRKVKVYYEVSSGKRYTIRSLDLPPDTTLLGRLVSHNPQKSTIAVGKPYQLSNLKEERFRLASIANDSGFYNVSADAFYYFLDTTVNRHQVDIFMRIAPPSDTTFFRPHYIGNTLVFDQYLLDENSNPGMPDTIRDTEEFLFMNRDTFIRPGVIRRSVLQRSGDLFSRELQSKTVNRLLDLGVFKFVNLKYALREKNDSLFLNRLIYLTPELTQDFSAELEASTEATNFLGSALSATYTHRNIFSGAERLSINFKGGVETQIGGNLSFINTLDITARAGLNFPTLLIPFKRLRPKNPLQGRTSVSIANQFQRRTNFFSLNSFQVQFGYNWRPDQEKQHELFPLNISQVQRLSSSPEFEDLLNENPRLRESFSNYFILGALYRFTYSNQKRNTRNNFFFFRGSLESSGNLSYGISRLTSSNPRDTFQLLGLPLAQFLRSEVDFQYHLLNRKTSLISRINIGTAIPYGNSSVIPFVRQFFVGGSNSIRAFQIRQLGPGDNASFTGSQDDNEYRDQTGDIKLEMNLEYRFPLVSYLKGALFVDAGNIWLYNESQDSELSGQAFRFDRFYRQMAVGTGVGFRLDITYFVLRLDLAFPIRKPYLEAGNRWVFDKIDFGSSDWRKNELVLNLALGYPF